MTQSILLHFFATTLLLPVLLVSTRIVLTTGFAIHHRHHGVVPLVPPIRQSSLPPGIPPPTGAKGTAGGTLTSLYLSSSSSFSTPTQEQSVALGIREWPQQTKSQSTWSEQVKDGQSLTRYILQGEGELTIALEELTTTTTTTKTTKKASPQRKKIIPGLLVEVTGPATLNWVKKDAEDVIIILTPGYEQGGLLIGVASGLIVLCGALIAGVGS